MIKSPIDLNGKKVMNRVVFQPMEGCDCLFDDGSPSELTIKKYMNNALSGAGIIWFEANAVTPEGRTNHRQMMITEKNLDAFKDLVKNVKSTAKKLYGYEPLCFIQLTHSGRQSIVPMVAYRHPIYEETRPINNSNVVSDEYLDSLPQKYLKSAELAYKAGFDGVDVKSCHGYLFQEILSGFLREGKYGGSFENRTKLMLNCVSLIKKNIPSLMIGSRISITDMVPKPYGFGTNEKNELDLTEPLKLIKLLEKEGVEIINITLGNPYYNPHVNRPFKLGAYNPNESREVSLKRFVIVGQALKKAFPHLFFVNSGLSYYRDNLIEKANELLELGAADFVGFGRVSLAYPSFYQDYLNNKFDKNKCCLACSKCTELMRHKQVAGCAVFNEYYRQLYKEEVLCKK